MRSWLLAAFAAGGVVLASLVASCERAGGPREGAAPAGVGGAPSADGGRFRLHPYLGYTYAPGPTGINAEGFDSGGIEYPYGRRDKEFVVGVFGAEAAQQVAENGTEIQGALLPGLSKRGYDRVTVLPFSIDGWRHPQTFHAFVAHLPTIDMAIFVDGLNEVRGLSEDWPADYPDRDIYETLTGVRAAGSEAAIDAFYLQWEERLRAMDLIGLEQHKPVVHFVEPNPYDRPAHSGGETGERVRRAYQRLRDLTQRLSAAGISSTFLGDAFVGVEDPVYEDECCRLSDDGAARLAWTIGQEIELSGQTEEVPSAAERTPPRTVAPGPSSPRGAAEGVSRKGPALAQSASPERDGPSARPSQSGSPSSDSAGEASLPLLRSNQ